MKEERKGGETKVRKERNKFRRELRLTWGVKKGGLEKEKGKGITRYIDR